MIMKKDLEIFRLQQRVKNLTSPFPILPYFADGKIRYLAQYYI